MGGLVEPGLAEVEVPPHAQIVASTAMAKTVAAIGKMGSAGRVRAWTIRILGIDAVEQFLVTCECSDSYWWTCARVLTRSTKKAVPRQLFGDSCEQSQAKSEPARYHSLTAAVCAGVTDMS